MDARFVRPYTINRNFADFNTLKTEFYDTLFKRMS